MASWDLSLLPHLEVSIDGGLFALLFLYFVCIVRFIHSLNLVHGFSDSGCRLLYKILTAAFLLIASLATTRGRSRPLPPIKGSITARIFCV